MPSRSEILRAPHEEDAFSTTLVLSSPGARGRLDERARGILTVLTGLDSGRVVCVNDRGAVTLGRSVDCTVSLSDQGLSRVHAQVALEGARYTIEDRGSRNGTFLNARRIAGKALLRDNDRIAIGAETEIKFSLVSSDEQATLEQTYEKATTDGLTGVFNRSQLDARLAHHLQVARRENQPLALAILDVDFFKKVNDTYGHLAGDEVLRQVARLLREQADAADVLARYGGEEFVVVGRYTDAMSLGLRVDQFREALSRLDITAGEHRVRVTCSAGVASLDEVPTGGPSALLSLADGRLYQAKQGGRNRVVGPLGCWPHPRPLSSFVERGARRRHAASIWLSSRSVGRAGVGPA